MCDQTLQQITWRFNYVLPPGLDLFSLPTLGNPEESPAQPQTALPNNSQYHPQLLLPSNSPAQIPSSPPVTLSPRLNRRHFKNKPRVQSASYTSKDGKDNSNTGVHLCIHCEHTYKGKNARTILRRHLKEKHGAELPRGTRWDNDPSRPKTDQERRQRMLDSKKRWAQKERAKRSAQKKAVQRPDHVLLPSAAIPPFIRVDTNTDQNFSPNTLGAAQTLVAIFNSNECASPSPSPSPSFLNCHPVRTPPYLPIHFPINTIKVDLTIPPTPTHIPSNFRNHFQPSSPRLYSLGIGR
ncbi:hypothetical protein G9A89_020699 [Geosiphon pyriformis]|nr:hypothetical protein G9A89_020699 [Geosiphon pyriformis]